MVRPGAGTWGVLVAVMAVLAACGDDDDGAHRCVYEEQKSPRCGTSASGEWEPKCVDVEEGSEAYRERCQNIQSDTLCEGGCCIQYRVRSRRFEAGTCSSYRASGSSGGSGSGRECTVITAGSCSDDARDSYCGNGVCCPFEGPYYCASNNRCYASLTGIAAECTGSCNACTGAVCSRPSSTGTCSTSGWLNCGSACCSPDHPYHCDVTQWCYTRAEDADAACGSTTCQICVP